VNVGECWREFSHEVMEKFKKRSARANFSCANFNPLKFALTKSAQRSKQSGDIETGPLDQPQPLAHLNRRLGEFAFRFARACALAPNSPCLWLLHSS